MGKKDLRVNLRLLTQMFLLVFILASCKKQSSSIITTDDAGNAEQKGKPAPGPVLTYLNVTVDDGGYKFSSDGGGNYVTGSQAVSAKFDEQGNFILSLGKEGHGPSETNTRWINVNFDSPIVVYIPPPIAGNNHLQGISTGSVAGITFIPLQNLSVGQSECVGLTGGTDGWVTNWHRGVEDVAGNQTAYAVFTRTSATSWTVTPAGGCSPNSNVCALRNGPGTLYGYYNMSFFFTLTKQ